MTRRLRDLIEAELSSLRPTDIRAEALMRVAMQKVFEAGRSDALLGLLTINEAAARAGVSGRRARAKLQWLEQRGLYTPIRVGRVAIVDDRFADLLRQHARDISSSP